MVKVKYFVLAAVALLVGWLIYYYNKAIEFKNTFTYDYKVNTLKTDIISNLQSLGSGTTSFAIDFTAWITNKTTFSVTLSNLKIKFYHNANYIGETNELSPIVIRPGNKATFNGIARFYINKALFQTALSVTNRIVRLDYVATFKIFGLPFNLTFKSFYLVNVLDLI